MSDFDPCECVWNHEHAMQRLLSILRSSQSYCTDNQCYNDAPGPQGSPDDGGFNIMLIMMAWIVAATALYLFRPESLRSNKPTRNDHGPNDNNDPPAPIM